MAKTTTKKQEGAELLENPELLASKAEDFFNDKKNQNALLIVIGAITWVVVAFLGYRWYIGEQNNSAQVEMIQAV